MQTRKSYDTETAIDSWSISLLIVLMLGSIGINEIRRGHNDLGGAILLGALLVAIIFFWSYRYLREKYMPKLHPASFR